MSLDDLEEEGSEFEDAPVGMLMVPIDDGGKIIKSEDIKIQIQNINKLFRKYPETIELYYHIIKNVIENYSYTDDDEIKQIVFYIINIIENDKSFILQPKSSLENIKYSKKKTLGSIIVSKSNEK